MVVVNPTHGPFPTSASFAGTTQQFYLSLYLLILIRLCAIAAAWHSSKLDLRKIPAHPESPEAPRTPFSDVDVSLDTPPPEKRTSEILLDVSGECEVLRKSSILPSLNLKRDMQ